ncbi:hypothetical protein [Mycobacterium avium]|uniref:Uncharacterized protein n=2 Tax=Mycobacterium avium TaxID=1764 RepID=A0A0H2ZVL7_MYCA1|nr:hypothetical protein [Mycobacterium avium]ABK65735.1 hypothetical protein MAV_0688 [Mycobacterium avium 104]MBZ4508131.1 hypothetical protein [Mycobacterium avium subsp. hominissuis]MCA2296769.1 hypothetical protein [Mycobacterium avium]MCG3242624.1 hypothetical protein [Mycobacterium avium subsp. hominissuis]
MIKKLSGTGEDGIVDVGSLLSQQQETLARELVGVFVLQAWHTSGSATYLSVHATEGGAEQRATQVATAWGVDLDQLDYTVTQRPVEQP